MSRIGYITIDVNDMERASAFWTQALDAVADSSDSFRKLTLPDQQIGIFLQLVPEPKISKTRMHLDLVASDPAKEARRLEGLGAKILRPVPKEGFKFAVLADPFGNEFCVLPA